MELFYCGTLQPVQSTYRGASRLWRRKLSACAPGKPALIQIIDIHSPPVGKTFPHRSARGYDFVFFIADDKRLIRIDFSRQWLMSSASFFRMCADLAFDGVCGSGSHPKHKGMPSIREAGNID